MNCELWYLNTGMRTWEALSEARPIGVLVNELQTADWQMVMGDWR